MRAETTGNGRLRDDKTFEIRFTKRAGNDAINGWAFGF